MSVKVRTIKKEIATLEAVEANVDSKRPEVTATISSEGNLRLQDSYGYVYIIKEDAIEFLKKCLEMVEGASK